MDHQMDLDSPEIMSIHEYNLQYDESAKMDIDQIDIDLMDTSSDNTYSGGIYQSGVYSFNNCSAETLPGYISSPTTSNSRRGWLYDWSSPSSSSAWLPGNLAKLPLELIFNILDEILIGQSPRLTHTNLHGLLGLRQASKQTKAIVDAYLERNFTKVYLQGQLHNWENPNCAKWYQSSAHAFLKAMEPGLPDLYLGNNPESDIITETIVDDCPDCFESLCKAIPGLSKASSGTNENGWTFLAIAIRSSSYKMLERLLNMHRPCFSDPPSSVLISPANCTFDAPSGLGMLAYQTDPDFADKALSLLGPSLLNRSVFGLAQSLFDASEKAQLSTYISVYTAEWLTRLGIQLWTPKTGARSAWHAGVLNGPEFLEFLYNHDPDGIWSPANSISQPIHHAVWSGRLDSFRWILNKTKELDLKGFRWMIEKVATFAADDTSPLSEVMLNDLLPESEPRELNYYLAGMLFKHIVAGLTRVVDYDTDHEGHRGSRYEHEQRAIRKCQAVAGVFFDTGYPVGNFNTRLANSFHAEAVTLAQQWGFEDLERTLYFYHGL